ncbi:FUSC family protein [Streptomyces sp. AD55]|uniref:FUSC family protein n=1 Tax=Streptomyces sp. AD55 TaxID=3242895 RepID=UPI0035295F38
MIIPRARPAHGRRPPGPGLDRGRGILALTGFGLCFGTVTAVAGIAYGVFAALGCYLDAYGARDPYPRRGPLLACLAGGFAVAFLAGSLAAGDVWTMVGMLSLVTVAATLFLRAIRLSGPGSYFVVLVAALTAFLPPVTAAEAACRGGCLLFGTAVSWLFCMAGRVRDPYGPEQRAVSGALRAVAEFGAVSGSGHPRERPTRERVGRDAYGAVHGAWTALDDARGRRSAPPARRRQELCLLMVRLETVLDSVQEAAEEGRSSATGTWVPWLRRAADDVRDGRPPGPWPAGPAPRAGLPPEAGAVTGTSAAPGDAYVRGTVRLPPRQGVGADLRGLLSRSSPAPPLALRVGLAVAVGTALGAVLPLLHPSWVAVGAAAALQGGPGVQPTRRAVARLSGTVAGVAVTALAFHSYQPGVWVTVACATLAHGASRTVPSSALFSRMLLSTPVALLLASAASPPGTGLGTLAAYRLLDLTLGLALGVATALVVRGVPSHRVCAAVSQAVGATGTAVRVRLCTGSAGAEPAGFAWRRTAELWTLYASVPAEEIRRSGTAERLWPTVLAVRRLLSWCVLAGPPAPAVEAGVRAGDQMAALATAARAGLPGSDALRAALDGPGPKPEPAAPGLTPRLSAVRSALLGRTGAG